MKRIIYLLLCPETGAVRYVGITKSALPHRLANHLSEARCGRKKSRRCSWIKGLLDQGKAPAIKHDRDVAPDENWEDVERERIAFHRQSGADLVNGTEGGIGLYKPTGDVVGRMRKKHTLSPDGLARQIENAKRVGAMNKGRKKSAEERAKMVRRYTGRKASEDTRAKMCVAQSARKVRQPHTAEAREKMSATRKGRKLTPEHRAAIGEALRRRKMAGVE